MKLCYLMILIDLLRLLKEIFITLGFRTVVTAGENRFNQLLTEILQYQITQENIVVTTSEISGILSLAKCL